MTVAFYFITAFFCLQAGRSAGDSEGRWWSAIASVMFALGINKELDLQSALTELGRIIVRDGQYYEQRAYLQIGFISLLCATLLIGSLVALYRARTRSAALKLALAGLFLLGSFIVIRAASFHHIDRWLRTYQLGLKLNWMLELGSISIILLSAMLRMRKS